MWAFQYLSRIWRQPSTEPELPILSAIVESFVLNDWGSEMWQVVTFCEAAWYLNTLGQIRVDGLLGNGNRISPWRAELLEVSFAVNCPASWQPSFCGVLDGRFSVPVPVQTWRPR